MKILLVANHYAVASGRYMFDTLKSRMGHDVRSAGQAMGADLWGRKVEARYIWQPDYTLHPDNVPLILEWAPDLVLVMDSAAEVLDWADNLPYALSPIVVYGVDNHVREYRRESFDHYFLAHARAPHAWHPAARNMWTWLPCATDDYLFPNSPIPWGERQYDVACIGVMYPERWEVVGALRKAKISVNAGTGLIYHDYRHAYQNARIALIQPINHDLPIRLFEGGGMGCALLSAPIPDMALLTDDPATYYQNATQAVELATGLLALEPKRAQQAADGTSEWALLNHTWRHRAEVILDWYAKRNTIPT